MRDNPSGAKMLERTIKVKSQVKDILETYPATKGSDMLVIYRWLRRYYPHIQIKPTEFKELFLIPSFETVRRRRQELQHEQRERIRTMLFQRHPEYNALRLSEELDRTLNGALDEFGEVNIQPTNRTRRKRARRETAFRDNFGRGEVTLADFESD